MVRVAVNMWGQEFRYHQIVSEPEPGRTLVETDLDTGQYTTFTFEPVSGNQTRLTIASEFPSRPGIAGWIEKVTQPIIARRLYQQELRNIADYVQGAVN